VKVERWRCDNCGKDVDASTLGTLSWRRVGYIGVVLTDETDDSSTEFCSWACIAEYAANQRRRP